VRRSHRPFYCKLDASRTRSNHDDIFISRYIVVGALGVAGGCDVGGEAQSVSLSRPSPETTAKRHPG
jgi:hypothetical protein